MKTNQRPVVAHEHIQMRQETLKEENENEKKDKNKIIKRKEEKMAFLL